MNYLFWGILAWKIFTLETKLKITPTKMFNINVSMVHDDVHDDMNMSLIMDDHSPVHSYDQHIIPHDQ